MVCSTSSTDWVDIDSSCSQVLNACGAEGISELFPLEFMHEYTRFLSFDAMIRTIGTDPPEVRAISDLVALDTPACDQCIADYTEFSSWRDLVLTACDYFLAENLR